MDDNYSSVADLLAFLRSHDVAVLATVNNDQTAHATTIYYYPEEDLRFYFLTRDGTKKFSNLRENHSVALVITDPATLQTVQIEGSALEVDYAGEYAPTVKRLTDTLTKNGMQWENLPLNHIGQGQSGYFTFVQVKPTWIRWNDYKNIEHKTKFEKKFS